MIGVMFVCYGNICRSPMAEFLFLKEIENRGIKHLFKVSSAATSYEEIGSPVHRGTRNILDRLGIDCSSKRAKHLERSDYVDFDYILVMDDMNYRDTLNIFGSDKDKKVFKILDFTKNPRSVADPWYTHNFDVTYNDLIEGIDGFLTYLKNKGLLEDCK